MKTLLLTIICGFVLQTAQAQLWNRLKESVTTAATDRLNRKAADKAAEVVDGADQKVTEKAKVVLKRKNPRGAAETTGNRPEERAAEAQSAAASAGAGGEEQGEKLVLKTNITCAVGKAKVEKVLRQQEGVFKVSTDTGTGRLTLWYSNDGTPKSALVELITSMGFDADGAKAAAGTTNACQLNRSAR